MVLLAVDVILATLTALALAADPPSTFDAPDPVLEWAERDLRALRGARVALAMSVTGPALMATGVMTVRQMEALSARESIRARDYIGASLGLVGFVATLAGPPMLAGRAMRSNRALRNQFLTVPNRAGWVSWGIIGGTVVYVSILASGPEFALEPGAYAPLILSYVGSISSSSIQLQRNNKARQNAGWLGDLSLTPTPVSGGAGVALGWTI